MSSPPVGNVRRGDVRTAIFVFLLDRPGHGYELMQYLEDKTNGLWRPSPGSIYPSLQQLEDEGLVRSREQDGRRVFSLTETGLDEARARVAARGEPWARIGAEPPQVTEMKRVVTELESAVTEVVKLGDEGQVDRAIEMIRSTRRRLYGLLAED